jgi:hypothetical protein
VSTFTFESSERAEQRRERDPVDAVDGFLALVRLKARRYAET